MMFDSRTTERVAIQVSTYYADGERYPSIIGVKADGDEHELAYVKKSEQAVAATLGAPTCEYVIEDNMNEAEGMGDVWFRCTNCDTCYDYQADDWLLKMPHCPKCGATVKAVN